MNEFGLELKIEMEFGNLKSKKLLHYKLTSNFQNLLKFQ